MSDGKVVLFFGVVLREGSVGQHDEGSEDTTSPAYLAASGKADATGVGVLPFGLCDGERDDHAVVLMRTVRHGVDWRALPVETSEVSPEEVAKIEAFLKRHRLTRRVDRKATKAPRWLVVPVFDLREHRRHALHGLPVARGEPPVAVAL
jgi:hypothetical protein